MIQFSQEKKKRRATTQRNAHRIDTNARAGPWPAVERRCRSFAALGTTRVPMLPERLLPERQSHESVPRSRSTSSAVTRLKSPGIVSLSALAAVANSSASAGARPARSA